MEITIDRQACIRCGMCVALCPAVFSMAEGETALAVTEPIGENCVVDVQRAAETCPTGAIHMH